jgi:hypothetical protein
VILIQLRFPFPPVEVLAEGTSFGLVLHCGGWLNLPRMSLKHCPPRHWGWPHGPFLVLSLELPGSVTDMACLEIGEMEGFVMLLKDWHSFQPLLPLPCFARA